MWVLSIPLVLLVYGSMNAYTGVRIFAFLRYFFPSFKAYYFWPLFILFCFSFILTMVFRLDWLRPFRQAAINSFPAVLYLFMLLLLLDGIRLVLQHMNLVPKTPGVLAARTGIALALTVITIFCGAFNARQIRQVRYDVTLGKSGEPFRIALVSDLHIGETVDRKWLANIVDAVNGANPDIICIAGDVFDNNIGSLPDPEGITAELRRFKAPLGVYACQGNHDVDRLSLRVGTTADRIREFLGKANIVFLFDEVVLIADRFYLAGRRDARPIGRAESAVRKTAAELAAGIDFSKPLVFMDHQPVDYPSLEEAGTDLILSGHTHRGQFFPGNVITAMLFRKAGAVDYGHWRGISAQGVVSSGAGVWGPPIRIGTISEVAVVNVSFSK